MIITKAWLSEWLEIDGISTHKICETLNSIGLEIESVETLRIPEGVVLGYVKECEKHPDADKLNVCQVDIGNAVVQIVCGAKNVAKGQHVAVATIGAVLGEDFKIKAAKLRGVDSSGMICSSSEIGLPKMNDGIMELDESIGTLELGKPLCEYSLLNDDIIEIELTANRGDCQSVHGVARDLSAGLDTIKVMPAMHYSEDQRGIASVTSLEVDGTPECAISQRFIEAKRLRLPFLKAFRLGCIEESYENVLGAYIAYAKHATGVILRAYEQTALAQEDHSLLKLTKDENGFEALFCGSDKVSTVGISGEKAYAASSDTQAVIEASYIDPYYISEKKSNSSIESDDTYYYASRGSEPDLSFGLNYLCTLLSEENDASIFTGSNDYTPEVQEKKLKIEHEFVNKFVGQTMSAVTISKTLTHLGFDVSWDDDAFMVTIPPFRQDVCNVQDIIEELVRIYGIDNITASPLPVTQAHIINDSYVKYMKRNHFRNKAAGVGFFEAVHFIFDNRETINKYGLEMLDESLEILNPITNELNTLRSTLILNLLQSAARNIKYGRKSVKLFEVGQVVDSMRQESTKMAFVFSGEVEAPKVQNHGKPKEVDFFAFADKVASVLGDIELQKAEETFLLASPYEYADIVIGGNRVGYMARVHMNAEQDFDLPRTCICEVDFDALPYGRILANVYSNLPSLSRDLSLLIPKEMPFSKIRSFLDGKIAKEVVSFAPIDIYEDESLGENRSVTVKFQLQSFHETMQEEQISAIMDEILALLNSEFGIGIR